MATFIDLFAGIGGFHIGMSDASFSCVFASEIDEKLRSLYSTNFGIDCQGDITKIHVNSIPDHDVLCAGFPCQAFSVAGKRKGFEDSRGTLFFEIERILEAKRPKAVFLENVKGLLSHDGGNTFRTIMAILDSIGYNTTYKVYNAMDFGLPQNRERVYIVGIRKDLPFEFSFPNPPCNDLSNISSMLESRAPKKYFCKQEYLKPFIPSMKSNTAYQWRRTYLRENKSGVVPTLTANMGTGGMNVPLVLDGGEARKLTPSECARLQGMDEVLVRGLSDSNAYKAIGNSVAIPVISFISNQIKLLF